jgi:hypothetical protein
LQVCWIYRFAHKIIFDETLLIEKKPLLLLLLLLLNLLLLLVIPQSIPAYFADAR